MRLGILVRSFDSSQLSYHILEHASRVLGEYANIDIVVFYENLAKPWKTPLFAVMNIGEAFGFDGVAIATSLSTAAKLREFPGPEARFFYAWDLEWVGGSAPYEEMADIYCDRSLPIIARSQNHAEMIERCWNRSVYNIVENFNVKELAEYGKPY
jgi:hypothetical protein